MFKIIYGHAVLIHNSYIPSTILTYYLLLPILIFFFNFHLAKKITNYTTTINGYRVQGFRPTSCASRHHNKENNQKAVANRQDDQKLIER